MDEKFYKDEFVMTNVNEVEYVRSPFYDLAKTYNMKAEEADELLKNFSKKIDILPGYQSLF